MLDGAIGDPELIALVRGGDTAAYEQLFVRHRDVALRLARRLADPSKADDIVAEAFAKILDLLQRGKGPDVAFRAYLLTTVRTVHLNLIRAGQRESPTDDDGLEGLATPLTDDADARFDEGAIARAFRQLPERWQSALWMTAVEGLPNEEVSRQLGIRANAVASLAFRARAGLRQAYLAEHLRETASAECARIVDLLPSFLRGSLTPRRRRVVEAHLERCSRCTVAAEELADVDRRLGALIAPVVVGAGAAAALWPATAGVPAAPVGSGVLAGFGGTGTFGALTTGLTVSKVAVLAAVAATGLGVTAHQLLSTDSSPAHVRVATPGSSTEVSPTDGTGSHPGTPAPTTHSSLPLIAPPPGPSATTGATTAAGIGDPTSTPTEVPSDTSSPTQTPSSAPTTAPTTARAMAVEPMSQHTVQHDNITWHRVSVPVSNPAPGSTLKITSNYTLGANLVAPNTSGWTCAKPKVTWIDANYLATTVTTCTYDGSGDGSPVQIDYWIGAGTLVRALLTPPADVPDTSTADNTATLHL